MARRGRVTVVMAKLVMVVEAPLACGTGEPECMLMGSLDVRLFTLVLFTYVLVHPS